MKNSYLFSATAFLSSVMFFPLKILAKISSLLPGGNMSHETISVSA